MWASFRLNKRDSNHYIVLIVLKFEICCLKYYVTETVKLSVGWELYLKCMSNYLKIVNEYNLHQSQMSIKSKPSRAYSIQSCLNCNLKWHRFLDFLNTGKEWKKGSFSSPEIRLFKMLPAFIYLSFFCPFLQLHFDIKSISKGTKSYIIGNMFPNGMTRSNKLFNELNNQILINRILVVCGQALIRFLRSWCYKNR